MSVTEENLDIDQPFQIVHSGQPSPLDFTTFDNLNLEDQKYLCDTLKRRFHENVEREREEYVSRSLWLQHIQHDKKFLENVYHDLCHINESRTKSRGQVAIFPRKLEIGRFYGDKSLLYTKRIEFGNDEPCYCVYYTASISGWCSYARFRKEDWEELGRNLKRRIKCIENIDNFEKDIFLYHDLIEGREPEGNLIVKELTNQIPSDRDDYLF